MNHRGYTIVTAKHPSPTDPHKETFDILDGEKVRKANISTLTMAKRIIDTMVHMKKWPDKHANAVKCG